MKNESKFMSSKIVNKIIIAVLLIAVIVFVVLYIQAKSQIATANSVNTNNISDSTVPNDSNYSQEYKDAVRAEVLKEINEGPQNNIQMSEDMQTKTNISSKVTDPKDFGKLQIKDMKLETKNNVTNITANVVNNGTQTDGGYMVTLNFFDDKGRSMLEVIAFINTVEPGQTTLLTTQATTDIANAADYTITKK